MAFNSFIFTFVFLPFAVLIYYALAFTRLRQLRLPFLLVATILFYSYAALFSTGSVRDIFLLLGSILGNYIFANVIYRAKSRLKQAALALGVGLNVAGLIYFKYTGFLIANLNAITGSDIYIAHISLPLAISFYTFQQIAYLVDTSKGLVTPARPLSYFGSILFFPSIISGPIVFFRELGPQLAAPPQRSRVFSDILIGLTIFSFGLFKKTVIADSLALWVEPAFDAARAGHPLTLIAAWGSASAYLLQIYYDFGGYSDMALGVARMLGILLPLNFYSPLRCTSILDYWRRWHMTLGRFVNLYIFQPIAIPLARISAQLGLGRWQSLIVSTLLPTFFTMVIIGAWHGGSWTFIVFGAMHGVYMVANEVWNVITRRARKGKPITLWMRVRGNLLTMIAVILAIVAFRSPDMITAGRIWASMFSLYGFTGGWSDWTTLHPLGNWGLTMMLTVGFAIAYLMPNTQQLVSRFEPALEWKKWKGVSLPAVSLDWQPKLAWAFATGLVLFFGLAFIARGTTKFVYFDF